MTIKLLKTMIPVFAICLSLAAKADSTQGENDEPAEVTNPDEIIVTARGREYGLYFSHWGTTTVSNPDFLSAEVPTGLGKYAFDRNFFAEHFAEELMKLSIGDRRFVIKSIATMFESLSADQTVLTSLKNSAENERNLVAAMKGLFNPLNRISDENPSAAEQARLDRVKQQAETSRETFREYIDQIFEVVDRVEPSIRNFNSQKDFFHKMIKCAGKF